MVIGQRRMVPNEPVVGAELDGEAILLNLDTGIYFGIDTVGTRIWRLITQGAAESEIIDQLLKQYDVDRAQLTQDVSEFLDLLAAKGLVRISD